jgi:superfamily II DNA or RNA helicase
LTNCNVLTEGFDQPRVDGVLMARRTQSQLLYAQMVGRGTRLSRGTPWVDTAGVTEAGELAHIAERVDLFRFEPSAEIGAFTEFA